MNGLLIGAVMIGAIFGQLVAQTYHSGTVVVLPPEAAVPALMNPNVSWWGYPALGWRAGRHGDKGFADSGYASDPYYYRDEYSVHRGVVVFVVMPQVEPSAAPPQPQRPPIQSEMHEYHWSSSDKDSNATTFDCDGTRQLNAQKQMQNAAPLQTQSSLTSRRQ